MLLKTFAKIVYRVMISISLPCAALAPEAAMAQATNASRQATQSSDFRIETDVMENGNGKPLDQSVTLFSNGVSYEYSRERPDRITVIDTIENRVTFLDTKRQVQSRVNLQELQAYIETARKQFAQAIGGAEKLKDASEVVFDSNAKTVTAGRQFIRYDAKIQQPANSALAEYYANFANASAVLNAWQSRGSAPPPFARMQLNQELRERAAIPTEIKRTVFFGKSENVLTSRIHLTYALSPGEQKLIGQYNEMILNFTAMSLAEFINPNPTPSR